jgi:hypothetical protein
MVLAAEVRSQLFWFAPVSPKPFSGPRAYVGIRSKRPRTIKGRRCGRPTGSNWLRGPATSCIWSSAGLQLNQARAPIGDVNVNGFGADALLATYRFALTMEDAIAAVSVLASLSSHRVFPILRRQASWNALRCPSHRRTWRVHADADWRRGAGRWPACT